MRSGRVRSRINGMRSKKRERVANGIIRELVFGARKIECCDERPINDILR